MDRNSNSTDKLTDAAGTGGRTNAGPPKYDTRPPPPMPAVSSQPRGTQIARDPRHNSGGN